MSIYQKLCLLIIITVALVFLPVALMVYTSVGEASKKQQERTFSNVAMVLVNDITSAHFYLTYTSVSNITALRGTLYNIARSFNLNMEQISRLPKLTPTEKIQALQYAASTVDSDEIFVHIHLTDGNCIENSPTDTHSLGAFTDIKGRNVLTILKNLRRQGDYVVFDLPTPSGTQTYLGLYQPVLAEGIFKKSTIFVYSSINDVDSLGRQFESDIALGVQEKLDGLNLHPQSTVALLDKDRRILAYRGSAAFKDNLLALTEKHVAPGQDQTILAREENEEIFLHSRYIKVLDWQVVAAVPQSALTSAGNELVLRIWGLTALVTVVVVILGLIFMRRTMAPLRILIRRLSDFPATAFRNPDQAFALNDDLLKGLPMSRSDELGLVARAFADMTQELSRSVQRLVVHTASEEHMHGELHAAGQLQKNMLPAASVQDGPWSVGALMTPANLVSGAFYDHFLLGPGVQAVVLGGVSERGLGAALLMSRGVPLIRYSLRHEWATGLPASQCLIQAVNHINEALTHGDTPASVALLLALCHCESGKILYVNAGECLPRILSPQGLRVLTGVSGPAPGLESEVDYAVYEDQLAPGEALFCYNDGVLQIMDVDGQRFGEARLDSLLQARGCTEAGLTCSPEKLCHSVSAALDTFARGAERLEDTALLVLSRSE